MQHGTLAESMILVNAFLEASPYCIIAWSPHCHFPPLPYCLIALSPHCLYALLPYRRIALLPHSLIASLPYCLIALLFDCLSASLSFFLFVVCWRRAERFCTKSHETAPGAPPSWNCVRLWGSSDTFSRDWAGNPSFCPRKTSGPNCLVVTQLLGGMQIAAPWMVYLAQQRSIRNLT